MTRSALFAASFALLLAACARDLPLPDAPKVPVIASFAPTQAFYGDTIVIKGSGFDANTPENNTVEFAGGATAKPFAVSEDGTELKVYVPRFPDTAAYGTIALHNQRGNSAPSEKRFYYMGFGHPGSGTLVAELAVLHLPPGIASIDGVTFMPSSSLRTLLASSGEPVTLGSRLRSFTRAVDASLLFAGFAAGAKNAVVALDPATRAVVSRAPTSPVSALLLAPAPPSDDPAAPLVFSCGEDAEKFVYVNSYTRSGETLVERSRPVAVEAAFGLVALPEEGVLVVVDHLEGGGLARTLVHVDPTDTVAAPEFWAPPAGMRPAGPIALTREEGKDVAAVALEDGGIALVSLEEPHAWTRIASGASSPMGALVATRVEGRPHLVGAVPRDSTVIAIDLEAREIAWVAPMSHEPTHLDADAASGRITVASAQSNRVDELETKTGAFAGRFEFAFDLGNDPSCACGGAAPYAYLPEMPADVPTNVMFVARRQRKLIVIDADLLRFRDAIDLVAAASPPLGLVGEQNGRVWVLHEREIGIVDKGAAEKLVLIDLPAKPIALAVAADGRVVIASTRAIDVYRMQGANLVRDGGFRLPETGLFAALEKQANGEFVALWGDSGDGAWASGGQWTVDELAEGKDPRNAWASPEESGLLLALLPMEFGPLALFQGVPGTSKPSAFPFDSSFLPGSPIKSIVTSEGHFVAAPDRRYFAWSRSDATLRLGYFYPGEGMVDYFSYRLNARSARPVFDPSGEWLYVPIPTLDTISIYQ